MFFLVFIFFIFFFTFKVVIFSFYFLVFSLPFNFSLLQYISFSSLFSFIFRFLCFLVIKYQLFFQTFHFFWMVLENKFYFVIAILIFNLIIFRPLLLPSDSFYFIQSFNFFLSFPILYCLFDFRTFSSDTVLLQSIFHFHVFFKTPPFLFLIIFLDFFYSLFILQFSYTSLENLTNNQAILHVSIIYQISDIYLN